MVTKIAKEYKWYAVSTYCTHERIAYHLNKLNMHAIHKSIHKMASFFLSKCMKYSFFIKTILLRLSRWGIDVVCIEYKKLHCCIHKNKYRVSVAIISLTCTCGFKTFMIWLVRLYGIILFFQIWLMLVIFLSARHFSS